MNTKPIIAIVGRPNVGKSTLFNRFIGTRKSIVSNEPGVTRDRVYGEARHFNKEFIVIDTGGFDIDKEKPLLSHVRNQIDFAMEEADIILILFDGKENITQLDHEIVNLTRKSNKPIHYVINKIDAKKTSENIYNFHELGIETFQNISSEHGTGISVLLDHILEKTPEISEEPEKPHITKIAIVGRPNVGKSLLINKLIGKEKQIVTDIPGTTIDAVDISFKKDGQEYILVDTAGIRKRGKIYKKIEIFSVIKAFKAIEKCHIGVLVVDATIGPTDLDNKIASRIEQKRRGVILAVNKIDLIQSSPSPSEGVRMTLRSPSDRPSPHGGEGELLSHKTDQINNFKKVLKKDLKVIEFAETIFISAKTGENLNKVLSKIDSIKKHQNCDIGTSRFNKFVEELCKQTVMPIVKNKALKIYYACQTRTNPQEFTFFGNNSSNIPGNFKKYLVNGIRKEFGLSGVPVRLIFKNR